jgi:hypothetical protein
LVLKNVVDYDKKNADIFFAREDRPGTGSGLPRRLRPNPEKLYSELGLPSWERLCVIVDSAGMVFAERCGR